MARITATHTLLPQYAHSAEESRAFYDRWTAGRPESFRKKASRIFETATIEEKHTIVPAEMLLSKRSFEESNNVYRKKAIELGAAGLAEILEKSGTQASEIDYLVTSSCTGFMIPSFGLHVFNALGMRSDVVHLPVTQIGCAGGVSSLIYADHLLNGSRRKKAAVISLEFPSNTMNPVDFSLDNIIGTALFSDGVACALLDGKGPGPAILDGGMRSVPVTTGLLGYQVTDNGLRMELDRRVPEVISEHFEDILVPFLRKNGLAVRDVDHFLVHPGGFKILDELEAKLKPYGKNIRLSRGIMKKYGNMSSATILFILDEQMQSAVAGETAVLLSFGPGFSAHMLLIRWG